VSDNYIAPRPPLNLHPHRRAEAERNDCFSETSDTGTEAHSLSSSEARAVVQIPGPRLYLFATAVGGRTG
jgi:hypothetical protein